MATITFVPKSSQPNVNWNDPTIWSGGVVPNDPSIDVVIPTVTQVSNGGLPFVSTITETGSFSTGSLSISNNNLKLNGTLSITHAFTISSGGGVAVNGVLSGESFDNNGNVSGSGTINSSGLFLNRNSLSGSGSTVTAGSFTNTGLVQASGDLHLTVTPGGFTNLSGSTLSGGSYSANGSLYLNVGGVIAVDAASLFLASSGMIYSFDDISHTYVPITSSLTQVAASGTLKLSGQTFDFGDLTVDGALTLENHAELNSSHLTVGAGALISGGAGTNGNSGLSGPITIDAGGVITGLASLSGPIVDNGAIVGQPQFPDGGLPLLINGPVTGSGSLQLAPPLVTHSFFDTFYFPARLELAAAASVDVIFQSERGVLTLDQPSTFSGTIRPTGSGDQIILPSVLLNTVTSYSYSGDGTHGTLAIHTTGGDVDLQFIGSFVTGNFALSGGPQVLSTDPQSLLITNTGQYMPGTSGDDNFTVPSNGTWYLDGFGGNDTITFNFKLTDATVSYCGNTVIIDVPANLKPVGFVSGALPGHFVLTGMEKYVFTDGTVDNNDGNPLVDDLFYYSKYRDVWNAHVDADQHYAQYGWHEERDPDAFFSTALYLALNQDVKAAGINPLTHFDQSGWKEGRVPSAAFDPAKYLQVNPDVAAAHVDPLAHFLQYGAQESRQPIAVTSLLSADGFDALYYLQHNPDVLAAEVDPHQHYNQYGWHEGRNPNALFDTVGYLANYGDVKAANVNPLDHYHQYGWREGRDPSVNFDTKSYLSHYPDVAAAHIDPLVHFLQYGMAEGRSSFADGVWG